MGAFAPAGTPKSIIDKLNADIQKLLRMQNVSEKLKAQVLEPMFMTPDRFAQRVRSDYEKYGKVIKLAGIMRD